MLSCDFSPAFLVARTINVFHFEKIFKSLLLIVKLGSVSVHGSVNTHHYFGK